MGAATKEEEVEAGVVVTKTLVITTNRVTAGAQLVTNSMAIIDQHPTMSTKVAAAAAVVDMAVAVMAVATKDEVEDSKRVYTLFHIYTI